MIKMNQNSTRNIKSRFGCRKVKKRKYYEEFETYLGKSSRTVVGSSKKKKKTVRSSTVLNNNHTNELNIEANKFGIGDMVWAKIGKYPLWPGIVINDPKTNIFFKKENNVPMLHVYYCNDAFKRNWIRLNQIYEFSSKKNISKEYPKIKSQVSCCKRKVQWNRAADEAECLAALKKDDRIDKFFANNFSPHELQLMKSTQIQSLKNIPNAKLKNSIPEEAKSTTQKLTDIVTNLEYDHNNKEVFKKEQIFIQNCPKDHPRILIPKLCKLFYRNGWVTGTGGGISIKYNDQIFIAPSGVQKERIEPEDLFVQDIYGVDIQFPTEKKLSKSQCTPIFMCAYTERNAGAVIHTHSQEVVKLCLLNPENELKIRNFEMIKGIFNEKKNRFYDNDEEVIIPIIENSKYERDLVDTFSMALKNYPSTSAIIVRNHGIYVWGKDWQSAKTQCECYEYLFNVMLFQRIHNL